MDSIKPELPLVDHNFTQEAENTSVSCDPLGMKNPQESP